MRIDSRGRIALAAAAAAVFLAGCGSKKSAPAGAASGEVRPGSAVYGRLAADQGVVYAAFSDISNGGRLTVVKSAGGGLETAGSPGFSSDLVNADYLSVAVDPGSGTPYLAFPDLSGVTVMKLGATGWAAVGEAGFESAHGRCLLALAGDTPYVAFVAYLDGHVRVMSYGTAWTDVGGSSPGAGSHVAFTLFKGSPHVAFNSGLDRVELMKYQDGAWSTVDHTDSGVTIDEDWGQALLVSDDTLYLVFHSRVHGAVMMKLNEGAPGGPALQSVGALGSISSGSTVQYVSGAIRDGVPQVAFDDQGDDAQVPAHAATVKSFDGTGWQVRARYPDSSATVLAADPSQGRLYLGYLNGDGYLTVKVP